MPIPPAVTALASHPLVIAPIVMAKWACEQVLLLFYFLVDSEQVFEIILYMTWFYNMALDVELGKAKALTNFQFIGLSFCFSDSLTIIKLKKIKSKQ